MRVAIITFPGSNCDYDCYKALTDIVGAEAKYVWHREGQLGTVDAVILPGGFSYGDYLRAGAIARFSPIMSAVIDFARAGGPVLGICNGFQMLCEAQLLPGALLRNTSLKFAGQPVTVRIENNDTMFTNAYAPGQIVKYHVAHGMGNYVAEPAVIEELERTKRVVFRYVDARGKAAPEASPNGATNNIAGIVNQAGNILGLMPHPERSVEPLLGSTDGLGVFLSLQRYVRMGPPEARELAEVS